MLNERAVMSCDVGDITISPLTEVAMSIASVKSGFYASISGDRGENGVMFIVLLASTLT